MKENRVLVLFVLLSLFMVQPVQAASRNDKSVNRVTAWNKVTDFFATVGKQKREKVNILRKRKVHRRTQRLEKAKLQAEKERQKRIEQYRSSYISQ